MGRTNKYSRPLLALLLLVAGLAGAMRPQRVAAQNSGTTGPLNWNYDAGTKTLSITGSGAMPNFVTYLDHPWVAFREQIEKVTIGDGVTSVGDLAFNCFTELTDVSLPDGLQKIGIWAFGGCGSLTNLTIPKSVTAIRSRSFASCTALKDVTVFWDTPLGNISADAFQGIELNKVKLYVPAGKTGAYQAANVWGGFDVQEIPGGTLSTGLHWQYIPSSHTLTITGSGNMPDFSFNLPWLAFQPQTVTIGAGVTSVGKNAFFGRTALKSVTLPDGLQTIGEWAFKGCWSLTNLILPKSVTSISGLAFLNCTGLKEVTVFWDTPLTISADAFQGIELNKVKLYVPAGKTGAYQAANVWGGFDVQEIPGGTLSTGLHWQYIPSTKTLSITGSGAMPDFDFIDQPWRPFRYEIETATIGAGVTSVGKTAFVGYRALKSVTLPAGLQTIKEDAFLGCTALTRIELPASLETIGTNALNAGGLTEIKVQTGNTHFEAEGGVLYNKGKTTLLCYPRKKPGAPFIVPASVTTIEVYAFSKCAALESITLPDALETIGYDAFNECTALKSITIPKKVGTIGDNAFRECTGLKDVTVFWNTPLTIPQGVFSGITPPTGVTLHVPGGTGEAYQGNAVWGKLTIEELPWGDFDNGLHWAYDATTRTLTITNPTPSTPQPIPNFNFPDEQPWKAYRGGIQKVTIGAGVNHVGKYAFTNCEKLTSVTLPTAGLKEIEKNAFGGCEKLTSINLPEGLKTIGEGAFTACFALSDLTIPKSVETIEENAFYQCRSLTHVTLPADAQLTTIGKNAFYQCRSLTNLTIPKNVTAIGQNAFNECLALKDVTVFWDTPLPTYADVFNHLTVEEIRLHVPEGKIGAYKAENVFWHYFIVMSDRGDLAGGLKWQMDATYTLTIINPTPGSPQPMPDFANPDTQPWESFRSEIQAVTIEDGVSSVGENAFVSCNKMTHVTLPKSVTTIRGAFSGCNKMTHVTLPADGKLQTIGKEAFSRCLALTSISLPKSTTTIEDRAFSNCEALTSVTLPADGKLQTIGNNAFGGCVKLKSITIPNSVTKIESDAFNSCKGLTSVTLPDNAQFTKIKSGTFRYCKALERITIPKSVTTIEDDAFEDCKALKDLTVAWRDTASIPKITLYVFQYTPPATVKLSDIRLHVPHGTVAAYQLEDVWKEFTIVEQPLPPTPTPEIPETPSTPPTPPVTGKKIGGIALSPSSFVLDGERTFRFSATISPSDAADKRLICTSSDESIVRVRVLSAEETRRGLRSATDPAVITYEGTVYGVGRATITVKSTDGSALRVTCPVDVRRLPTSTVDATPTRLYTADGQLHLTLPASATVRVYNVSGRLVRTFLAPAGDSSVALPEGIYVVRVGDHTEKIVVVK